ncbi:uncharacterized protein LOC111703372 [Eurytemora carolleeae]|uniref:uncharacterized protein LOC111703372 n=1 Tax=Eurytemora carolleeae TaxID=1294199 RepID=UPI000C77BB87|nr:uncharacterized protein LOC111703372 [Eurytemora carolleeae]|eukprot:XP_023331058.1 uncharacterized protein LOC111703372 [Eurytemora affinis]
MKNTVYYLILLYLAPLIRAQRCDTGWTEANGVCLKNFQEKVTWFKAKYRCIAENGKLTESLRSASNFPRNIDANVWVGANDLAKYGEWVFASTGVKIQNNVFPGYAQKDDEHCLLFNNYNELDSQPCDFLAGFICEKELTNTSQPSNVIRFQPGGFIDFNHKLFNFDNAHRVETTFGIVTKQEDGVILSQAGENFRSYSLAVKGGKLTFYTERGRTLSLPNMINDGLIHDIKFSIEGVNVFIEVDDTSPYDFVETEDFKDYRNSIIKLGQKSGGFEGCLIDFKVENICHYGPSTINCTSYGADAVNNVDHMIKEQQNVEFLQDCGMTSDKPDFNKTTTSGPSSTGKPDYYTTTKTRKPDYITTTTSTTSRKPDYFTKTTTTTTTSRKTDYFTTTTSTATITTTRSRPNINSTTTQTTTTTTTETTTTKSRPNINTTTTQTTTTTTTVTTTRSRPNFNTTTTATSTTTRSRPNINTSTTVATTITNRPTIYTTVPTTTVSFYTERKCETKTQVLQFSDKTGSLKLKSKVITISPNDSFTIKMKLVHLQDGSVLSKWEKSYGRFIFHVYLIRGVLIVELQGQALFTDAFLDPGVPHLIEISYSHTAELLTAVVDGKSSSLPIDLAEVIGENRLELVLGTVENGSSSFTGCISELKISKNMSSGSMSALLNLVTGNHAVDCSDTCNITSSQTSTIGGGLFG